MIIENILTFLVYTELINMTNEGSWMLDKAFTIRDANRDTVSIR